MKLKTKIWMRRWIICRCDSCVKKKWSKYQKKTSKVLPLFIINVCIWGVVTSTLTQSRTVVFINPVAAEFKVESTIVPEAQSSKSEALGDGSVAQKAPQTQMLEGSTSTDPSPVRASSVVEEKIREAFPEDPNTAVAIAKCESQLDPTRIGDTNMTYPSIGLFQINQTWHKYDTKTLQNADENIRIAKDIKDRWGNWNAWSCYKFNFYQKYL